MIKLFEDTFALLGGLCLLVSVEEIIQLKKEEHERSKLLEELRHQAGDTDD